MTEWWQTPYPGGKMVAVPGFPRELHVGVNNGPDVVAVKRTVWRAGRWQGPASGFDPIYSKRFAKGAGPNVVDSGVAGVQRQQSRPDDGVVTEEMFNLLRSIRIPDGLPHAGEAAMDATAQNLIAEAYYRLHPVPVPVLVRERALEAAQEWVGYTETPAGSNQTVFGAWYGMDRQPWCAMAATYWYEVDAGGSAAFVRGSRWAYVPYIVADARAGRNGLSVPATPEPGDLVCFDWHRDGTFDHVGLFEQWAGAAPSEFWSVEGNTSPDQNGSQSNGGGVYRRLRDTSGQDTVFVRVAE